MIVIYHYATAADYAAKTEFVDEVLASIELPVG